MPKRPPASPKKLAHAPNPNHTGFASPATGAATLSAVSQADTPPSFTERLASADGLPAPPPGTPIFREPASGPTPPHSYRLQIVRARGGYVLFAAESDFDQADADPCDAVAVASTPDELLRHIDAWALAQPPAEYPA